MLELKISDIFKTKYGLVACVDYFENYKDYIGEIINLDGLIFKAKEIKEFTTFIPSMRPQTLGILLEDKG